MRVLGPITRILGIPIVARLMLILAVVEAIFLAESFTTLLEEALRQDAVAADVAILLLFKVPEIFDLALAVGMLIAVYFVVTDARNRGELVILASSGIRWSRIVSVVLVIGLIGGAVSLATAGFISPLARYASRIKMAELQTQHIVSRIEHAGPLNTQQTIRGVTFIATPPKDGAQRRGQLFVFQPNYGPMWRTIQSRNWHVTDADDGGQRKIILEALSAYEGVYPKTEKALRHVSRFSVADGDFAFGMSDVTTPPRRDRSKAERMLDINAPDATPRIAKIATRALMVPMAALLALAAIVAAGSGIGRYIALPLAALVLMAGDILARSVVAGSVESFSPLALILLALAIYLGPPLAYLARKREVLMIPAGRRS
ncbi:LptF/LptG family permease [Shimia sp.]|uniref:LptF/LptG family permease n=1 Tax=Shimia sp. TaxID=1954381 RepID=UPI0032983955